ncbi:MAG: acyltransferase [Syntrophomonadaceae bacterium]|nr:acyltransferase [Syntrophomonadaceae bacterium]
MSGQRSAMFDVLKGLGIMSVVFSHVYRGGTDFVAVFVRELAMWSVPMFFMVQGHFMPAGARNWLASTWKRLRSVYAVYLVWATAYGVYYWVTVGKKFTLLDLVLGRTARHLYYMFHYIVFAVFCPLLYFLPRPARLACLWAMVGSNLALTAVLEVSRTYQLHLISYSGPNPVKWWGFVAVGMLVAEYPHLKDYIARHARTFFLGALAVALVGLFEPYLANTLGYLFNKVALWPLALGLTLALAIYYSSPRAWGTHNLAYVGQRTFGIYLGHFFLVDPLRRLVPGDRTLVAIVILLTCLAVIAAWRRLVQRWRRPAPGTSIS